jgi:hypothetical protein
MSGPSILLRLLTRLSGQFSLLSSLMVVLFGHRLSRDETGEGWPKGFCSAAHLATGMRAERLAIALWDHTPWRVSRWLPYRQWR